MYMKRNRNTYFRTLIMGQLRRYYTVYSASEWKNEKMKTPLEVLDL